MNKNAVETYQCPGCVNGSNTQCGSYHPTNKPFIECEAHVPGTIAGPFTMVLLGLPKGFNRFTRGTLPDGMTTPVRIMYAGNARFDDLNVPVWAHDDEHGNMLARTFLPRIGVSYVDVVLEGRKAALAPGALDPAGMDID